MRRAIGDACGQPEHAFRLLNGRRTARITASNVGSDPTCRSAPRSPSHLIRQIQQTNETPLSRPVQGRGAQSTRRARAFTGEGGDCVARHAKGAVQARRAPPRAYVAAFGSAAPAAPKGSYKWEMLAAAAYLRVSTTQQDWKLQRDAVTRAARARGDTIPKRLWFEEKKSGRNIERPVLQKLRDAVRAGHVGRVYVFRIDRLTRSGIRDTLGLVEEFKAHGAELVTVADGFNLAGPGAEIVLAVMAWAAQMERNAIGERIKAARVRIEAAGGRWGRPRRVDPTTLEKARALERKGKSVRAIAIALKVPRSTLSDALSEKGHYATK